MVNRFELLGNLTHTPELLHTAAGSPFCFVRLATNRFFNNQQRTDYHFVTVWAQHAQRVAETLSIGDRVFVDGRIECFLASHDDARRAQTIRLVASRVLFLHRHRENSEPIDTSETEPVGRFVEAGPDGDTVPVAASAGDSQ